MVIGNSPKMLEKDVCGKCKGGQGNVEDRHQKAVRKCNNPPPPPSPSVVMKLADQERDDGTDRPSLTSETELAKGAVQIRS